MDQNTPTNGSDKRNWRERLGISAKEMPRISGEFKTAPPPSPEKAPVKAPQPVTKPAPMAPRAPPARSEAAEPGPKAQPQDTGQAPSALAEKLRAQREAAEKLAVQRVSAARQRAEAKPAPDLQPSPVLRPLPAAKAAQQASGKPKFTFAEEEFVNAKKEAAAPPPVQPPPQPTLRQAAVAPPPLTPPRPALGGERTQPPLLRPAAAQPQFRADPPPSYRPIDPAPGYSTQRSRPFNLETGASPYTSRLPARRGTYDPYRRGPDGAGYEPSIHPGEAREARAGRPAPARARPALPPDEDDYGDEFEDEAPRPRHRASASEYNSAYRDVEDSYKEDHRRSSGPWLLLLALLLAAAAAGGGIWLYQTKFKTVAFPAATDAVPVVAAPEGAAKTAAEPPPDTPPATSTASKKQIYDRIVGDREVTGEQMVPAETAPLQPEPQQAGEDVPPATDSGVLTDESTPLPLPPPPGENSGDSQGSIDPANGQDSVAVKPEDVQRVIAKPVGAATEDTAALLPATGEPEPLPPPEPSMEQMAVKAAEPAVAEPAVVEPVPLKPAQPDPALAANATEDQTALTETPAETVAAPPVKKKAAAAARKKKPVSTGDTAVSGAEPVVLVPPSQSADVLPPSQDGAAAQVAGPETARTPVRKKKRTLMDLINGGGEASSEAPAAVVNAPEQGQNQQVASLPDPAPPASTAKAGGGTGYVVQLASFRSEAEAQAEYSRLALKHSGIVGNLPSRVSQATVSGSTRYRLGLGPLGSREEASRICNSLVAAGERDCLVRRQ